MSRLKDEMMVAEEELATAHLFAAAPDLLKEGEGAIGKILMLCADVPENHSIEIQKALMPLWAAIAKAKGESS